MGDMGEVFREMTAAKKQAHSDMKAANTKAIELCGIPFVSKNGGESLLFRDINMPKVDFYPSTGRWKVAGEQKTYRGGANGFINWYIKQVKS